MSQYSRRRVYGLWKDNQASYHFHTPVEYEVLAKNPTHYQKITNPVESGNFPVKNEESIHDSFYHNNLYVGYNVSHSEHLIRILTIGQFKNPEVEKGKPLKDYAFWIPRRMIRRGPNSWKRKTNRWIHEKTAYQCFARALRGNPTYNAIGYYW